MEVFFLKKNKGEVGIAIHVWKKKLFLCFIKHKNIFEKKKKRKIYIFYKIKLLMTSD